MRKVVASAFVSMDGVMQAPGGPDEDPSDDFGYGGWTVPYFTGDNAGAANDVMGAIFEEPYDLLLGRRTYEIFAAYWPFVPQDDPIGQQFNATTKYVATNGEPELTWEHSIALHGAVAARIRAMKSEAGRRLLVQGSSVLLQTLLAEDLLDELTILTFPIVLGSGKRLFGDGAIPRAFDVVSSQVLDSGVVVATYRRAGAVQTGSFELDEAAAREADRQLRMRQRV